MTDLPRAVIPIKTPRCGVFPSLVLTPHEIPSRPIVYGLSPFQVPGERRGPLDQVRQIRIFGGQIKYPIDATEGESPSLRFCDSEGLTEETGSDYNRHLQQVRVHHQKM